MRDLLPNKCLKAECGILNLDTSENSGTHWTCWYKNDKEKYYFDSYGLDPPIEMHKYLNDNITCNTFMIQELNTNYCGHLCLIVLKQLSLGNNFESVILNLYK